MKAFAAGYAANDRRRRSVLQCVLMGFHYGSDAPKQTGFLQKSNLNAGKPCDPCEQRFLRLYLPLECLE